jgi:hypothetical protein
VNKNKICNVVGCGLQIPDYQLMCDHHWTLLPRNYQVEIVDGVFDLKTSNTANKLALALHNAKVFLTTKSR